MRDLTKDLEICESMNDESDYHDILKFACAALAGWPEAIRRAMAAEKIIRKLLNTPDGRGICGVYALEELEELAEVLNREGGEQDV